MDEIVIPQSWKPLIPFLAMLVMGIALVWPSNSDTSGRFWGWIILFLAGPLFMLWLLKILKGEPAFVINDDGILDGTRLFKKCRYSWDEIKEIRRTGNPFMGQRSILIKTSTAIIPISEDRVAINLEDLNRKIKQTGEFHGKARVDRQYRNAKMTVGSFEMTLIIGLLFAVLIIGGVFLMMADLNVYQRLIAFWPISLAVVLVFWYFPESFNTRFRNRRHPPVKYLLLTSLAAMILVGFSVLQLGKWLSPKGAMVLGVLAWLWFDQIIRRKFAQ